MIRELQKRVETALQDVLQKVFGLAAYAIPDGQFPEPQMGDLSYTLAFPLAKVLKKNPKVIAHQIMDAFPLAEIPEIRSVEIGGNGYLNFRFHRNPLAKILYGASLKKAGLTGEKAIVEHTNINPNKAAHVGHLRNAVLGDMLVRLLRFHGTHVEVQNYIDDTGVQLADVVVGFRRQGKEAADLNTIEGRADYYFWDLYAEAHQWIDANPEGKAQREQTLRDMEERHEPVFSLSQQIADRIIRCHLKTMARLGIDYDLLPRESDIIGLKFWQRTFELLKEKNAIMMPEEGKNKGCWIMRLAESETFEDMQNPDKVIVRSNGIVTYVGKDIAYQLWKFGLLGATFRYQMFDRKPDGSILWVTSTQENDPAAPNFGGAQMVYNVIDQRQSYLQKVVAEGLRALGYHDQANRSIHFAYEMVTLSPKTALELGFELSREEQEKAFVEMSGRKGLGVKADDLLDRLEQKALERIRPLYADLAEEDLVKLAATIASGALRYFMVRYARNTIITFDLEEALSFEGETGPYLQYSLVRARSIFLKLRAAGFDIAARESECVEVLAGLDSGDPESNDSWSILMEIFKTRDITEKAVRSLEFSYFAKHVFQLGQLFNNYYHKYPVLHEADEQRKLLRIAIVKIFMDGMQANLDLLGIPVPERM